MRPSRSSQGREINYAAAKRPATDYYAPLESTTQSTACRDAACSLDRAEYRDGTRAE